MDFGLYQIESTKPVIPVKARISLPRQWQDIGVLPIEGTGHVFRNTLSGMAVITSEDTMEDGKKYLHVSCSFADHLPTWDDLKMVKETFIGDDRVAYQVFPRKEEYVNVMQYCLHLWSPEP